jgi:predicted ATPase
MITKKYVADIELKRDEVDSFDRYPFSLPAVRPLEKLEFHPAVTFFIGENGSGKSTLLEAIAVACGFNAEGGSKNFRFGTRESHSELHRFLRVSRGHPRPRDGFFFRAESFFNVATEIEKLDAEPGPSLPIGPAYGEHSLHEQSHGESFLALVLNRFRGNGLYLLDEPEAALSPFQTGQATWVWGTGAVAAAVAGCQLEGSRRARQVLALGELPHDLVLLNTVDGISRFACVGPCG